jgi:lipid A 3-O-deacylase
LISKAISHNANRSLQVRTFAVKPVAYFALALAAATFPSALSAAELFGGLYVHDVDTPLTFSGIEGGADIQIGLRGGRIGGTPLQPYGFVAVNSSGETSYGAIGLSAKFGDRIYIRPGVGLALHTGSTRNFQDPSTDQIDFGSRVLFEPEVAVGAALNDRLSLEASWIHMSHGTLLSRQNPGIDNFGVRVNLKL